MCGLAGLFLPRQANVVEARLDAMVGALRHRGPDGQKTWVSDDRRYQAGFARLAIIDLETGDQPMVESSGSNARVLMGNGEIYNYVELRAREAGYRFRSEGDMEVVLPLARRMGPDFVDVLNGIYALALYESEPHRLTLVRDRLGAKPLYWAKTAGGGVLFASEIKALFASGLITPAIDEAAVSSYLAHGYVPAPDTLYKGVRKLAPGHRMIVSAEGAISIERYWQPAPDQKPLTHPVEARERLLELMRDAVRLQLRSDVPLGALLSGGLDSGMIVALAAETLDRPLHTYTVRFEGAAVDEAPLAAEVAARYGTTHTTFDLETADVGAQLPSLAWYADEPLFDATLLPNYLITKELAGSVKVALSGTGGDELFAGYPRYFPKPIEQAYVRTPQFLRQHLIEPAIRQVSPMTAWQLARVRNLGGNRGAYLFEHSTLFPPPMRTLIGNRALPPDSRQAAAFDDFVRVAPSTDLQTGGLAAEMTTALSEDLLALLDRTTMAAGVEGRVPLLDHRLVGAALSVPESVRTPGGHAKALQRDIAREFLPSAVINAPKQGFASPVAAWFGDELGSQALRILTRRETLARGWWTQGGIDALFTDVNRHGARIYALLMLELAIRIHVEDGSHDTAPTAGLAEFAEAA
ncbi:MAG: asparagine synthase (glutamine-hydrolyzing) [Rhodospirillales bacterium]|nr:asparagine synthase (glutamine-hydrolyzing) [Rhodospirillales bacterium]